MSERRGSTRSLVSWEKDTLAWGSQAQWKGSEATQDEQTQFSHCWVHTLPYSSSSVSFWHPGCFINTEIEWKRRLIISWSFDQKHITQEKYEFISWCGLSKSINIQLCAYIKNVDEKEQEWGGSERKDGYVQALHSSGCLKGKARPLSMAAILMQDSEQLSGHSASYNERREGGRCHHRSLNYWWITHI